MDFSTGVITIVATNIAMIVVMVGTTIGLRLYTDKKFDAIQEEMKEFHTRLATQDLEFKMRICAIEEKAKRVK